MSQTRGSRPSSLLPTGAGGQKETVGLIVRAILVVVLAIILVGGMRWAIGITNANTRLISSNLNNMQSRLDRSEASTAEDISRGTESRSERASKAEAVPGPSIEPVESESKQ